MAERLCPTPVDVVLLAGRDPNKAGFNGQYKFSLEVGGRDMLTSALDALDGATFIDRVFVVAPADVVKERLTARVKDYIPVEQRGSLIENISAGVERQQQLGGKQHLLLVCSDLPFLTSPSVDWLVVNSQQSPHLQVPVVPQSVVQELSPTYETYYWPMKEFSFKLGNNIFVDASTLNEQRIQLLIDRYRNTGSDNYALMSLNRIALLREYGGAEAVYTVMLNYLSKLMQIKYGAKGHVPFSGWRTQSDYQRILSRIIGRKSEFLASPFVDVVLDVDNSHRLGIFQRGYERISQVVQRQAVDGRHLLTPKVQESQMAVSYLR